MLPWSVFLVVIFTIFTSSESLSLSKFASGPTTLNYNRDLAQELKSLVMQMKIGKRGTGIDFGLGRGYSGSQVMWRLWKWMNDASERNREYFGSPSQLRTNSLEQVRHSFNSAASKAARQMFGLKKATFSGGPGK